jgi:hypothetical protein
MWLITGLALATATMLFPVALVWRAVRRRQQLARRLNRGEWRLEPCPACHGRGACAQCGGMGTLGLMGKPCPWCGGGEQQEKGRLVTRRGSGRCTRCGGSGQVYLIVASGEIVRLDNVSG